MSAGIKVNLSEIEEIADKYSSNSDLVDKIHECEMKLIAVKEYYDQYESESYKILGKKTDQVSAEVRSISNNFPDISDDLYKYVNKMKEDNIVIFDEDVFVAKDLSDLDSSFVKLERKIYDLSEILSRKITEHINYENEFNLMTQVLDDSDESVHEKKTEIKEMQVLQETFIEKLTTCKNNKNISEFYRVATEANQEIKDWYDRDFNAKDHGVKIAKFGLTIVAEVGIMATVATIGAPELLGVAFVAGLNGVVTGNKAYNNGHTSNEAIGIGTVNFGVNMATGSLGIYGNNQVAKKEFNEMLEKIEGEATKRATKIAEKNSDEMLEMMLDPDELDEVIEQMNLKNFTKEELYEITKDVTESKSQQEVIKEIDEYLDNKGLDSSSEVMEILVAILKDGTK